MNDFTVRMKLLPAPSTYNAKDINLHVVLHDHFSKLVRHLKKDFKNRAEKKTEWNDIFEAIDKREFEKSQNVLESIELSDNNEDGAVDVADIDPDEMIAEISFGKTSMQDIEYLKTMSKDYEQYLRI